LVRTNLTYDWWESRNEDWWRSRLILGIPLRGLWDLAWRVKRRDQIWVEPEGMLATFHVFYEFAIAVIKGGCVLNYAIVPGASAFKFRSTQKRNPGLGYAQLK
jgi:hypothetical protein